MIQVVRCFLFLKYDKCGDLLIAPTLRETYDKFGALLLVPILINYDKIGAVFLVTILLIHYD